MSDTQNLNPTVAAKVAMIIWGEEYSQQRGGSMDFWDRLSASRQRQCELVAVGITKTVLKHLLEPTPDMCVAGIKAMEGEQIQDGEVIVFGQPKNVFRAMIEHRMEEMGL